MSTSDSPKFYEFFAGGGMARAGFKGWECIFSNDFDEKKADAYRLNYPAEDFHEGDVWKVSDVPTGGSLAWASSPCQDLSLAGKRVGLKGERSAAFWGFWGHIQSLGEKDARPEIVVVENVVGLLSSHSGQDFSAICDALVEEGYQIGAVEIDASIFVPQSRQRVFLIGARGPIDPNLVSEEPIKPFHTTSVKAAYDRLGQTAQEAWVWWKVAQPNQRTRTLRDVLEPVAADQWHSREYTDSLILMMSDENLAKLKTMQRGKIAVYGTGFRRMREVLGVKTQRVELRFDGVAGCLRTPRGGSSSQFLIEVKGDDVRTRRLTAREAARLMGLPDTYQLPSRWTAALKVMGDGVVVDVVSHLREQLFEPILSFKRRGHKGWQKTASVIGAA